MISTTLTAVDAGDIDIDTSITEISGFRAKDQVPSLISAQAAGGGEMGQYNSEY
ncbi:MAG: hypothetical protein HC930_13950 [Hydrococcus sp. SU_1_0]|nr:hypothetical protein [Hydrococcus sp. SU_1_0]